MALRRPCSLLLPLATICFLLTCPAGGKLTGSSPTSRGDLHADAAAAQPIAVVKTDAEDVPYDDDGGKCPPDEDDTMEKVDRWVWPNGGVVAIIYGVLVSFWVLAAVVEEFFVPSLNIMCEVMNIPSDVAGATFMAAGASSPEMFANIISLFITHSKLGVGTIIGSEIFNHLCICAGAVAYSKSGMLKLEPRILLRECGFYALACGLLVFSMSEAGDHEGQNCKNWTFLRWYHGVILFSGYVAYALVCSFYKSHLMPACCPLRPEDEEGLLDGENIQDNGALVVDADGSNRYPKSPKIRSPMLAEPGPAFAGSLSQSSRGLRHAASFKSSTMAADAEPAENFAYTVSVRTRSWRAPGLGSSWNQKPPAGELLNDAEGSPDPKSLYQSVKRKGSNMSMSSGLFASLIPALAGPENIHREKEVFEKDHVECYIWKKSRFYNAFRLTSKTWQMRWAVIDKEGFRYYKTAEKDSSARVFNIFQDGPEVAVSVSSTNYQKQRNIFELCCPMETKQKLLSFQAQDYGHLQAIQQALAAQIKKYELGAGAGGRPETLAENEGRREAGWRRAQAIGGGAEAEQADEAHEHESLLAWPATTVGKVFHVLLLPWKFLMWLTMVDVRHEDKKSKWWLTCTISVLWLAVWSYVMTFCVEKLGELLSISDIVMGLTVSAAGTSFPNVFASMLVARQGLGNMAISNAFGSNVFNIFVGLGIPWFFVCVVGTEEDKVAEKVYHGMPQGGVGFPVLILLGLLCGFLVQLWWTGMRIYMVHAYVYVLLYIGFLVWSFGWNAKGPDMGGL